MRNVQVHEWQSFQQTKVVVCKTVDCDGWRNDMKQCSSARRQSHGPRQLPWWTLHSKERANDKVELTLV
ncbi:hypothetical protein DPMN_194025 [Dreissena polymorpha]|uniref:Uncharacterized protein n=1 Tax=Dreissena polymorpha TaxID=45954 RepID=A0A9D3Y1K5_DREPO|nr:hypothetical protein DPMN_194025 [Dreissena polymorpha]